MSLGPARKNGEGPFQRCLSLGGWPCRQLALWGEEEFGYLPPLRPGGQDSADPDLALMHSAAGQARVAWQEATNPGGGSS